MFTMYNHNVWNCAPSGYRNGLTRSIISDIDPDVCTLQECSPDRVRVGSAPLPELLRDKYTEVCPEKANVNYTAVFYKTEKYNLLDSGYFIYDGLNDANSKSVCWGLLEDKNTKTKIIVAATHFWWMFESEKDNQQRLENVNQLKAFLDEIQKKYDVPTFIGGDFNNGKNSDQGEEPYHYMLKLGFNDIRLSADETTDEFTHHDYPVQTHDEVYESGPMPVRNLDNIFTYGRNQAKAKKFEILTSEKALASSDHCPLIGYFELD